MNDTPYRSWMCVVCGFIYEEANGLPDDGIAPGTRWEDVPDTWTCPDCGPVPAVQVKPVNDGSMCELPPPPAPADREDRESKSRTEAA